LTAPRIPSNLVSGGARQHRFHGRNDMHGRIRRFLAFFLTTVAACVLVAAPAGATMQVHQTNPDHDRVFVHFRWFAAAEQAAIPANGITISIGDIAMTVPPGGCVDRGNSCVYTNAAAQKAKLGTAKFKLQYKSSRMWLTWYGDTSSMTSGDVNLTISVPGYPPSVYALTFTKKGYGWFNEI
jgi:hypothetical protein